MLGIMKTLLLLTDFSATANHAMAFGYNLAKLMEAEIILCNVVNIPAEIPQYETVILPIAQYHTFEEESVEELKKLKKQLEHQDHSKGFHPPISCLCETGILTDQINQIISSRRVDLIIMGTHASSGFRHLLLGNHTRYMVDAAQIPLLVVSSTETISMVKWIAFATGLNTQEIPAICNLVKFAKPLEAEIILMYVNRTSSNPEEDNKLQLFLDEVRKACKYPKLSYQSIADKSIAKGLEFLCNKKDKNGLLSIVHKNRNFINEILMGSQTQKLAKKLFLPLMILPSKIN